MDINIESGLTRMLIEVMVLSSRQLFLTAYILYINNNMEEICIYKKK